jgi:glutamyl-tRNA reductase
MTATVPEVRTLAPDASIVAVVAHARTTPSETREEFAAGLERLGSGPAHIVVHTCHRVELYLAGKAFDAPLPPIPERAEVLTDADAVRHLVTVACGLDSAVIGETQILHQLRETVTDRHADRPLDPALERLFQSALHAGRTAHAWFTGSPRSLADVALDRIEGVVGPLTGRRILVVGVGRMGRLAAFAASRRGVSVVVSNRSTDRGLELAAEVGGRVAPFGVDGSIPAVDGIVVAISGPWRIGQADADALVERRVPVVDLSSPPAVPSSLRLALADRFVSVDDLSDEDGIPGERLRLRLEKLITDTGREYCDWLRARDAVPAIHAVVTRAERHRRAELERLRRRLDRLSEEELALVDQMSHRLVAAILHAPLAALNGDASGELERAARELFGV